MQQLPPRVLVVEDEPAVDAMVVTSLEQAGLEVVGVASHAREAVQMASRTRPDVALVDPRIPGGGALATKELVGSSAVCRVIALASRADRGEVLQMLLAGAIGYVTRGTPADQLLAVVRDAAKTPPGLSVDVMMGVIEDLLHELVDRSESEELLRRSEERFRGLVESAPDAVVIVNPDGEIVLVNRQTELMFGYERDLLRGRPVEVLIPERFHRSHIDRRLGYRERPRTRRMGTVAGLAGRRRDGTEFPVDISLSVHETDQERLIIAFVRDVSA
jgi:PAS domain S-box-containing protein